jgi:CheY-like chemotaxis protein
MMGGELYVKSAVGEGSTFWFALDLPEVSEWKVPELSTEQYIIGYTPIPPPFWGERGVFKILVVDDKPDNRAVLVNLLLPLGFDVLEAVDGRDGLNKLSEFEPDLILMDLVMPVMDGFEAIRHIRKSLTLKHIKIIAVSASSSVASREICAKAACNDFIPKPVQAQELFEKLQTHLGLEWIYEGRAESTTPEFAEKEGKCVAPPPSDLEILYNLADFGNFHELRKQLDAIKQTDPRYKPFVEKIHAWAKVFAGDEICEFIEHYGFLDKK